MARRHLETILSKDEQGLDEVWEWFDFQGVLIGEEQVRTLDAFLTGAAPVEPRYFGKTRYELEDFFDNQREELKLVTMLLLLSATEAALRVKYIVRVIQSKKDEISKKFIALYRERKLEVSLEEHILETWITLPGDKSAISEFKGALNLRHWLAHGRYWKPRLGREYDPLDIYEICDSLLKVIDS